MAISKEITVTVKDKEQVCELNQRICIYQFDKNIDIYFTLLKHNFTITREQRNLIRSLDIGSCDITLINPSEKEINVYNNQVVNDTIKFTITSDLTDELSEIGIYKMQLHLKDDADGVISIYPFEFEVKKRLGGVPVTPPPTDIPVTGVSLNKTSHTFKDFTTLQLNATVLPVDATDKSVYWSSTNANVATVSQDGLVTAKSNGTTVITVMTYDGNKRATCSVLVDKDEEVIPPTYEFDVVNKTYRGSKSTIVDIEGVCTYPNIDYWEVNSPNGWVGVANSFSDGRFKLELPIFLANKTYSNCVMYAKRNKTGEEQEDTIVATAPTKFTLVVEDVVEPPPPTQDKIGRMVAYTIKPWENAQTALVGLDQFKNYNYDSALLCLPVDCSFTNNNPFCNVTESQINMVCNKVESLGIKPILKMHTVSLNEDGQGNTDRPQNPATWFANYRILVNKFADIVVKKGYKEFIISNEMHNVMNLASNKSYMTSIINDVKSKGLKVSMSMNTPEVRDNDGFQFFNELDFYCMNTYPQLTNNSVDWARDNFQKLKDGFYTAISPMDIDYGTLFKNMGGSNNLHKDIWITEFGCIPSEQGLLYPAFWGSGQVYNEEVQKLWLHSMFDVVEKDQESGRLTNRLKSYALWDGNSDSDFNPIGNQAQVVLDTYWGDGNIEPPPTDDGNYFDFNNEIVENYACTSIIDKTNKTIKVSSDFSTGYYGYLIWDTSNIREGRRYRLTCKSSSDKTFVRFKVDDKKVIDQAFKTSYSIEFTGVNTKEKVAELNFGIRNVDNIGEISSIFSEIELIDLDGTPPPIPSTDISYDVVDYKIIVKKDNITESYYANDDIPVNLNGNGGVDGYKLVIKNRRKYYLSLTRGTSQSKITIDGMKPFDYSYIDQDFKNTWSNRGYAVKNNTLKYTIANRVDNDEYGITNDRTINPSVLTEALRVYNCAMPGYMEITQDQNSVNSVSEASFEDNFLGICRLYQGEKFHVHQNIRLLGGFGNSSRFYVAVLVHELGHTTGIWDDSPHYPTVYIYNRDQSNEWLQPSDIACIKDKFPHLTGKSTRRKTPIKTNNNTDIIFDYPHYKTENEMIENAHKVVEGTYVGVNDNSNINGYVYNLHEFECEGEIVQVKIHESFDLGLIEGEKYKLYLNEFDYLLNPKETIIRLG